jgi:exopolysaccharide production protein ExoZ
LLFYALFGILIWAKPKWSVPISGLFLAGILLRLLGVLDNIVPQSIWLDFLTKPLNLEFIFGCCSAYLALRYRSMVSRVALYVGLFLLIGSIVIHFNQAKILGVQGNATRVFGFGIPFMLIVWGLASIDLYRPVQVPRPFLYLGNMSYSLYLIHVPAMSLLGSVFAKLGLTIGFAAPLLLIGAIASGGVTYSYIEKPMLRVLRRKFLPSPALVK